MMRESVFSRIQAELPGVLVSGGNVANMLGLWAARASVEVWDVRRDGMRADGGRPLRVYGSAETHTWIEKAADLFGLDRRAQVEVLGLLARRRGLCQCGRCQRCGGR